MGPTGPDDDLMGKNDRRDLWAESRNPEAHPGLEFVG